MKYKRETLVEMYKDGLVSEKVVLYHDIVEKIHSMTEIKRSQKVKIVAGALGINKQTVWRALRMMKS